MAKKDNKLTEIVAVIDKSGSMKSLQSATIEGFNEFLDDQKKLKDKAVFSLILFSSPGREDIVFNSVDINEVDELNYDNYTPKGTTALYDAIGKSIKAMKNRIKKLDKNERPSRVVFLIITDGEENSSRIYDRDKVFKMISKREEKDGWNFVYIGANQDSFAEGRKIGIKGTRTMNYKASTSGVMRAYSGMSDYVASFRSADTLSDANSLDISDTSAKKTKTPVDSSSDNT